MSNDKPVFVNGLFAKKGNQDWVKAKVSAKVEDLIKWLEENQNDQGYVNFEICEKRDKSALYAKKTTYQGDSTGNGANVPQTASKDRTEYDDDLPF